MLPNAEPPRPCETFCVRICVSTTYPWNLYALACTSSLIAFSVLIKPSTKLIKMTASSLKYHSSIYLAYPFSTISLHYSICKYRTFISLTTDSIIPCVLLQPPNLFLEISTVTSNFLPRSMKHTCFSSIIPLIIIITS